MPRPLNILHVLATLSVGGAERLIPGLVQQINPERFSIHVSSLAMLLGDAMRSTYDQLGIPLTTLYARRFYEPRVFNALVRYIQANQIDLVHTHLTDADIVGRIAGRIAGVPVVSTLHNVPHDYRQQNIHRRILQRMTAYYATDRLIAVSPRIRDMFIQQWGIAPRRIVSISNAVPMDAYLTLPTWSEQLKPTGPLITTIGRLTKAKAQHLFLEAARQVLRHRPDAQFMLVGQGDREHDLRNQVQTLGIADRVIFAGLRHDIPDLLGQSDIFTLSSLWEGLPVTAVEAMAAARPCVLTDVGGCRDLIDHEIHGLIVPPGDASALAKALIALLTNPARAAGMASAARARVQRDFGMHAYTTQHEQLYEAVVAERRNTPRRLSATSR